MPSTRINLEIEDDGPQGPRLRLESQQGRTERENPLHWRQSLDGNLDSCSRRGGLHRAELAHPYHSPANWDFTQGFPGLRPKRSGLT